MLLPVFFLRQGASSTVSLSLFVVAETHVDKLLPDVAPVVGIREVGVHVLDGVEDAVLEGKIHMVFFSSRLHHSCSLCTFLD